MKKTKIEFKNVLAGIGLGFLVLFLVAIVTMKMVPDNDLTALLLGDRPNIPLSSTECNSDEFAFLDASDQKDTQGSVDISTDKNGNIYIVQSSQKRVLKMDKDFNPVNFSSTNSPYITGFDGPKSVSVNENGDLFIVDDGPAYSDMYLYVYDETGKYQRSTRLKNDNFQGNSFDYVVATDRFGNSYVANSSYNLIEKINPNGVNVFTWKGTGSKQGEFNYPNDLAVDKEKNLLYVLDDGNKRIQIFDLLNLSAVPIKIFTDVGLTGQGGSSIELDSNGNLYVFLETTMTKYDSDGKKIGVVLEDNKNIFFPYDFIFGIDGSIYMVDDFGVKRFQKYCGKIIIVKDTVPDNSKIYFNFQTDFGNKKDFILRDNGEAVFPIINNGVYSISEDFNPNYKTKITCIDPTNNTVIDSKTNKAIIKLDIPEVVTCKFVNNCINCPVEKKEINDTF